MSNPTDNSLKWHLRRTFVLGLPLVGAQLAQMLIGVTDTIMLGWVGTEELAAGTLAFQAFFLLLIFGLGFGAAIVPMIAVALGKNEERAVRRSVRMGFWALIGLSLVFMIPLWFTKEILIAAGQKPELAQLAENYMRVAQWSMIPAFLLIGARAFLTGFERGNLVLAITLAGALLNGVLNYAFIFGNFGAPRLEMVGAGLATLIANIVIAIVVLIYLTRAEFARPYQLFVRFWKPDWQALREINALGVPISLSIFSEAGLFSATSIMIGWIGTAQLAAHGIALQWTSLAFMIPLGFAQAASVRVGNAYGRDDKTAIGRAGYAVIIIAFVVSFLSAILFIAVPEPLIEFFLDHTNDDAKSVLKFAIPLLAVAAAFQLVDNVQVAAGGSLRGLKDTKVPLVIAVVSYWLVGLPIAYILGFPMGYGSVGIWAGLAVGLALAAFGLTYRFMRREQLGLAG